MDSSTDLSKTMFIPAVILKDTMETEYGIKKWSDIGRMTSVRHLGERNKVLLDMIVKFKPNMILEDYITNKTGEKKEHYSLGEVLRILKQIITKEELYDDNNPSIIMCSKQLEEALDQKALHVTEIRDIVLGQVEVMPDQTQDHWPKTSSPQVGVQEHINAGVVTRSASIHRIIKVEDDTPYRLSKGLYEVIKDMMDKESIKETFTYKEIKALLIKYIELRRKQLFDPRNAKVALVKDHPLGKTFGVQGFHYSQIDRLLRKQLTPASLTNNDILLVNSASDGLALSMEYGTASQ